MSKLDPEECARLLADAAEKLAPEGWTTDDWGDFWLRLTEECTLRLIRYKPEMVTKVGE